MVSTDTLTMDTVEQRLARGEAAIARIRAAQMTLIREADRRQAPMADGCRSMVEWVTGRLDIGPETARTPVSTTRRLDGLPAVAAGAADGSVSFDRAAAIARIANPSEDGEILEEISSYDVAGIQRLVAYRRRTSRSMEREAFEARYVAAQPDLDESSRRVYGSLPGPAGRVFVEALDARCDSLPEEPDSHRSRTTRYADALWATSLGSLAGGATERRSSLPRRSSRCSWMPDMRLRPTANPASSSKQDRASALQRSKRLSAMGSSK